MTKTPQELGITQTSSNHNNPDSKWEEAYFFDKAHRFFRVGKQFYLAPTTFVWSGTTNPNLEGAIGPFETLEEAVTTYNLMGGKV